MINLVGCVLSNFSAADDTDDADLFYLPFNHLQFTILYFVLGKWSNELSYRACRDISRSV